MYLFTLSGCQLRQPWERHGDMNVKTAAIILNSYKLPLLPFGADDNFSTSKVPGYPSLLVQLSTYFVDSCQDLKQSMGQVGHGQRFVRQRECIYREQTYCCCLYKHTSTTIDPKYSNFCPIDRVNPSLGSLKWWSESDGGSGFNDAISGFRILGCSIRTILRTIIYSSSM